MTIKSAFLKPWYALLLSVFFVLHGFTENFYLIPARDTLFFLLACLGISLMLIALFWLFFKNIQKAAFLTFLLLAFNYFFGYIHDGLKLFFPSSFVTKYSVLLSAAFLVFVLILILLKRRKEFSKRLTIYLNLLFLISIITDTGILIKKSLSFSYDEKRNLSGEKVLSCTEKNLPDVYLIVADEYAGSKDLADICGFDNTPFLDSLRQRGFFVANNSHSNYNYTTYSMASVLNMDYLPLKQEQVKKADHGYALKLIFNNKVTSFFKNAGYEIRNYSSFDISGQPAQNNNSFIPARTTLFASQTLINRLKKDIWLNVARILNLRSVLLKALYENQQYNQQIYQHAVSNIHDADTLPEFVYIHLQLPHYPYYYDKDGNLYPLETISNDVPGNTKNYVQYVQYTNRVLLKMTDEILTHKGPPPVIILMSDHGYRCFPEGFDPYIFMNLFSVYLPHKDYSLFSDSLTNVNVFRKVLNSEFCQQFPMLKDSSITVHN